jgi:hypothetical protein
MLSRSESIIPAHGSTDYAAQDTPTAVRFASAPKTA